MADLRPYEKNPRRISKDKFERLKKAISDNGYHMRILATPDNRVIGGHQRIQALKELGVKEVPILMPDRELTDMEFRRILIQDNLSWAQWDFDALANDWELEELVDFGMDENWLLESWPEDEKTEGGGLTDADECPEPEETAITQPGDIWLLDRHRLSCSDASDLEAVKRLMNGHLAGLMNTDAPYGVSYANDERPNPGVAKPRVANDQFKDAELQKFLELVFGCAANHALTPNAAWYMWHAHLTQGFFSAAAAAAAAAAEVILHRQIVWVKPVLLLGRGQYHWKHECAYMGWRQGHQPPDYGHGDGERNQTTVWEVASVTQTERKEFNHSTPKPVELFNIPIIKHLKAGENCYEPFAGSGPQIIAAEINGVCCFASELEPRFVDVIVRRWQKFTGKDAILESSGESFRRIEAQVKKVVAA